MEFGQFVNLPATLSHVTNLVIVTENSFVRSCSAPEVSEEKTSVVVVVVASP